MVTAFDPTSTATPGQQQRFITLDAIRPGPALRTGGLNAAHVVALAEVWEGWPPVLVMGADNTLVDGHHRFAAAQRLGLAEIAAFTFAGSRADAYIEAVRCNVTHGLPLTLSERRMAASQILSQHPEWADRRVAACCGLSAKTVKRLRNDSSQLIPLRYGRGARVGRDGRVKPLDADALRARILAELDGHPDASLRAIARSVGASPETVRSVRNQLRAEPRFASAGAVPVSFGPHGKRVGLRGDEAFVSREDGAHFAEWFDVTSVQPSDLAVLATSVPLSRVYVVADEARRRAAFWKDFADAVERRALPEQRSIGPSG